MLILCCSQSVETKKKTYSLLDIKHNVNYVMVRYSKRKGNVKGYDVDSGPGSVVLRNPL